MSNETKPADHVEPAFPITGDINLVHATGMTMREYAAIQLKVPDSGIDWLDAMIRTSQRDDFAAKALTTSYAQHDSDPRKPAEWAYHIADAMLKAREA